LIGASERIRVALSILYRVLVAIIVVGFLIAAWQFLVTYLRVPEILLPTPYSIYVAFLNAQSTLYYHTGLTTVEIVTGFIISALAGVSFGTAIAYSKILERILYPIAILVKLTPAIAIAPLMTLWFGYGMTSKIVVVIIGSFFYVIVNTALGLQSVDPALVDLMHSLAAPEIVIFFKVRLPSALPYVFSALKLTITSCVIGATVAEWVGSVKGLGGLALLAASYHNTSLLFVAIIAVTALGIALFGLVALAERILIPWRPRQQGAES